MSEDTDRRKIEAVLYTTGKFMDIQEIADACGIGSVGYVKEELSGLRKEYGEKGSALEIQEYEGKFKLNIRKEYGFLANKLLGDSDFDAPTTKTLAVIAYKSPVMQSEIIKIRGNKAYDHVKQLKDDALVTSEKSGRTRILKLTQKFFEYFDVSEREMKESLEGLEEDVKKKVAWKMGTTPEKIKEIEEQVKNNSKENKENEIKEASQNV